MNLSLNRREAKRLCSSSTNCCGSVMPVQARSRLSPYAFVVFKELHFANVEFFFFRAFPTSWVGLYFMGRPVHFVPIQPHKTAPQRRPKGSLSLTQKKLRISSINNKRKQSCRFFQNNARIIPKKFIGPQLINFPNFNFP